MSRERLTSIFSLKLKSVGFFISFSLAHFPIYCSPTADYNLCTFYIPSYTKKLINYFDIHYTYLFFSIYIVKLIKWYIFREDSKCKGSPEKCGRAYNVKTKFLHREGASDERSEDQVCVGVGGLAQGGSAPLVLFIRKPIEWRLMWHKNDLNFKGIDFPVDLRNVSKFEKQSDISVNVYYLKKE